MKQNKVCVECNAFVLYVMYGSRQRRHVCSCYMHAKWCPHSLVFPIGLLQPTHITCQSGLVIYMEQEQMPTSSSPSMGTWVTLENADSGSLRATVTSLREERYVWSDCEKGIVSQDHLWHFSLQPQTSSQAMAIWPIATLGHRPVCCRLIQPQWNQTYLVKGL